MGQFRGMQLANIGIFCWKYTNSCNIFFLTIYRKRKAKYSNGWTMNSRIITPLQLTEPYKLVLTVNSKIATNKVEEMIST